MFGLFNFFGPQRCGSCGVLRPLSALVAVRSEAGVLVGFHCYRPDEHPNTETML